MENGFILLKMASKYLLKNVQTLAVYRYQLMKWSLLNALEKVSYMLLHILMIHPFVIAISHLSSYFYMAIINEFSSFI